MEVPIGLVPKKYLGESLVLPAVYFIAPDGKVAMVHRGNKDDLASTVASLLKN